MSGLRVTSCCFVSAHSKKMTLERLLSLSWTWWPHHQWLIFDVKSMGVTWLTTVDSPRMPLWTAWRKSGPMCPHSWAVASPGGCPPP